MAKILIRLLFMRVLSVTNLHPDVFWWWIMQLECSINKVQSAGEILDEWFLTYENSDIGLKIQKTFQWPSTIVPTLWFEKHLEHRNIPLLYMQEVMVQFLHYKWFLWCCFWYFWLVFFSSSASHFLLYFGTFSSLHSTSWGLLQACIGPSISPSCVPIVFSIHCIANCLQNSKLGIMLPLF